MPHKMKYRVRKEADEELEYVWLLIDTETKLVVQTFEDPNEAHQACGTMNYQHKKSKRQNATGAIKR